MRIKGREIPPLGPMHNYPVKHIVYVHIQSALGWDHQEQLSKHESQTDAAKGFGGKYGVQKDSQDKVSVWT